VAARDHQQAAQRDVLADHHAQLRDLGVAEVLAQFGLEGLIHRAEVAGQLLGEANCQGIAWLELALALGQVDLLDGLLVESLTRRRRVPGEESGVAAVQGRDLEPRQLLDAAGHDTVLVAGAEKGEVPLEELGDQFR
jgi:hypothetical protein